MSLYVLSGSATGIGAATAAQLSSAGHEVLSLDVLPGATVQADLCTAAGRAHAVKELLRLAPDGLDGLVPCAGLGPTADPRQLVALNYYGVLALLEGLQDALAQRRGSVVLLSSNSAPMAPHDSKLVQALLEQSEEQALTLAEQHSGQDAYTSGKMALTRWMRRQAAAYAKRGIRLNAVAPGLTITPMTRRAFEDPQLGKVMEDFEASIPVARAGRPEDIAAALCFLLGREASFCCGSVLFVDGGSDALMRADKF